MTIQPIGDDDVDAVVALWRACDLIVPWNDPQQDIARARQHPNATVLVDIIDGAVAASAMVGYDGHRGWLYYVAVDPARRGRGLGRGIVAAAEAWLRHRDVPKAQLLVREGNSQVEGFYERIGYANAPFVFLQKWLAS